MIEHVMSTRSAMAKIKSGEISTDRQNDELRDVDVTLDFTPNALSSLLYKQGDTTVLVCVTKAPSLPRWFPKNSDRGWVHAEYSLLPGSTDTRFRRERSGAKGRTMEIERLVARSLRGAVDLEELGAVALTVDCDILNADGGTRCASITAACIALRLAIRRLIDSGDCLPKDLRPTRDDIANGWTPPELTAEEKHAHEMRVMANDVSAISVGLIDGEVFLDLDYVLDSNADVDMNVVGTSDGMFVEVQGTGEESTYSREQFDSLMDMAELGLKRLQEIQYEVLREA